MLETIVRRWYAFGFLAAFFWAASAERGWKRALRFWAIAMVIEFTAEFLSTHTGFPFGSYTYTAPTRGQELYLSNVPLFVPMTFVVVVWAGRSLAQVGLKARRAEQVVIVGAVFAALLDLIIDPMTLRGRMWFLGPLYEYDSLTGWFNVPWTNFAGWVLVAALILFTDELFETGRARTIEAIRGPTLAVIIAAFFIVLALFTRQWAILLGQLGVAALIWIVTAANVREAVADVERAPPEEPPHGDAPAA